jgi:hypothetical protein
MKWLKSLFKDEEEEKLYHLDTLNSLLEVNDKIIIYSDIVYMYDILPGKELVLSICLDLDKEIKEIKRGYWAIAINFHKVDFRFGKVKLTKKEYDWLNERNKNHFKLGI